MILLYGVLFHLFRLPVVFFDRHNVVCHARDNDVLSRGVMDLALHFLSESVSFGGQKLGLKLRHELPREL
jgi:hypothetical protein